MTSQTRGKRVRTVDGLRGLAALLVVFDHTVGNAWGLAMWTHQNHGIVIFALLSAFLLSGRFLQARMDHEPLPSAWQFLRARVVRIYPAYWVTLAVASLTIGLYLMGPGDVLRVTTLTQVYDNDIAYEGLPPTWSLSLFMTFYVALVVWAYVRSKTDRPDGSQASILRREIFWLAAAIPLALVIRQTSTTLGIGGDPYFSLLGRLDWFALGMILAALMIGWNRGLVPRWIALPGRRPLLALAIAVGLSIVGGYLLHERYVEARNLLDTACAALLVAAIVFHGERLRGPQLLLASRPARALGRWSYGIFLWGYVVSVAILQTSPGIPTGVYVVLTFAVTILLGAASWRFIEEPVSRHLRGRRQAISPRPEPAVT